MKTIIPNSRPCYQVPETGAEIEKPKSIDEQLCETLKRNTNLSNNKKDNSLYSPLSFFFGYIQQRDTKVYQPKDTLSEDLIKALAEATSLEDALFRFSKIFYAKGINVVTRLDTATLNLLIENAQELEGFSSEKLNRLIIDHYINLKDSEKDNLDILQFVNKAKLANYFLDLVKADKWSSSTQKGLFILNSLDGKDYSHNYENLVGFAFSKEDKSVSKSKENLQKLLINAFKDFHKQSFPKNCLILRKESTQENIDKKFQKVFGDIATYAIDNKNLELQNEIIKNVPLLKDKLSKENEEKLKTIVLNLITKEKTQEEQKELIKDLKLLKDWHQYDLTTTFNALLDENKQNPATKLELELTKYFLDLYDNEEDFKKMLEGLVNVEANEANKKTHTRLISFFNTLIDPITDTITNTEITSPREVWAAGSDLASLFSQYGEIAVNLAIKSGDDAFKKDLITCLKILTEYWMFNEDGKKAVNDWLAKLGVKVQKDQETTSPAA